MPTRSTVHQEANPHATAAGLDLHVFTLHPTLETLIDEARAGGEILVTSLYDVLALLDRRLKAKVSAMA
jgi:hypothetical protein